MMTVTKQYLTDLLRSRNIRPSYQRIMILKYMVQKGGHPTADEIFRASLSDIPILSIMTVYNTLRLFSQAGLVRIVDIDNKEKRYDLILTNHGHFLCEICGAIINFEFDIDKVHMDGLDQFKITQKDVYFRGLCPDCQKQKESPGGLVQ